MGGGGGDDDVDDDDGDGDGRIWRGAALGVVLRHIRGAWEICLAPFRTSSMISRTR